MLPLFRMPEISIDLPKTRHGYSVKADQTFWVKHGILRSTDLRDSMDEHLLSDIIACTVNGSPIERSKQALDEVYSLNSVLGKSIDKSLSNYGESNISDELKYIISQIDIITSHKKPSSLRSIIFKNKNTNAYPTVFATLCLAFHNLFFKKKKHISSIDKAYDNLENIAERIKTGPGATSEKERKKNLELVIGVLSSAFVDGDISGDVYGHPSVVDFENLIRHSPLEHASFEFKQGFLNLDGERKFNNEAFDKLINTICAMANCGPNIFGHVFIGVCDKKEHANKIAQLDSVEPLNLDGRMIVGIAREAILLKKTLESYVHLVRDKIGKSLLSDPLKAAVSTNMSVINYYGRDVLHVGVPSQQDMSWVGDQSFFREADQTMPAAGKKIAEIASRF